MNPLRTLQAAIACLLLLGAWESERQAEKALRMYRGQPQPDPRVHVQAMGLTTSDGLATTLHSAKLRLLNRQVRMTWQVLQPQPSEARADFPSPGQSSAARLLKMLGQEATKLLDL